LGVTPSHAPRLTHELVLAVDAYGHPTKTAAIAYGHPTGADEDEQKKTWMTAHEQALHATADDTGDYRHGVAIEERHWELGPAAEPTGALWIRSEALAARGFEAFDYDGDTSQATVTGEWKRLLAHTRTLYLKDDGSVGSLGEVGGKALVHEGYAM